MGLSALIFFICLPIFEIITFVTVSNQIGPFVAVLLFILTTIAGFTLLRFQRSSILIKAKVILQQNQFPIDVVFDEMCIFCAGLLLVIPGFLTDILGLFVYLPTSRRLLKALGSQFLMKRARFHSKDDLSHGSIDVDIIDGDFHDITKRDAKKKIK